MRANTIWTVILLFILSGLITSCANQSDLNKYGLKGKVKSINESSSNPKNVFGKWESNGNVFWTVKMNFDEKGKYMGMEIGDNKIIPKYENEIKVEESQYMKNGDLIYTSKFQSISENEIDCDRFQRDKKVVNIKSFYENNRLSKMIYTSLYPNDNTKYTEQYTYDKNDNMVEAKRIDEKGERVSRFEYPIFDDKKNWIQQLVYNSKNDENPSVIVVRQIEYYGSENGGSTISENIVTNHGDKFLGTYVYAKGESDYYRTYKIVVSKNSEDYLLTLYRGNYNGQYREERVVGRLNGTSIEINSLEKYSFIENGSILIYNGPSDSNGREFLKQK